MSPLNHWALAAVLAGTTCLVTPPSLAGQSPPDTAAVSAVLDDFHAAASAADLERYFGHFARDAVFLGTDASERWTVDEFRTYVRPFFDAGRGWTYRPTVRRLVPGPDGTVVWFDELLINASYGTTRGSGVLIREGGAWRIGLYDLSIPIPNPLAREVVALIARGSDSSPASETDPSPNGEVRAALQAYYDALSARDWDRFQERFWPGAILATVWQPPEEEAPRVTSTTVPEFVARAPEGPGSREIFEERMLGADIRVEGPLATAWVRYRARFGDPGDVMEWEGTDVMTLIRHDDAWRIVSIAYAGG